MNDFSDEPRSIAEGVGSRVFPDVVQAVVASVAPEELPAIEGLRSLDPEVVSRGFRRNRQKPDQLGFGVDDVVVVVTPVVWIALDQAVRKIIDSTIDGARARRPLSRLLRRIRPGKKGPVPVPTIKTTAEVALLRDSVKSAADRNGLDQEKIDQISDLLIALLSPKPATSTQDASEEAEDTSDDSSRDA